MQYYEKKNYIKAMSLFEELIPVYKGTDKAEEIYYYYSYCNFYNVKLINRIGKRVLNN